MTTEKRRSKKTLSMVNAVPGGPSCTLACTGIAGLLGLCLFQVLPLGSAVVASVSPRAVEIRQKDTLSVGEATLGAKIEVPTLEGRVTLTVPAGTDSGTKLRLRGKGVAAPSGGAMGDLYVNVQIRVPRDVDDDAAARLEELAKFDPPDLRKDLDR